MKNFPLKTSQLLLIGELKVLLMPSKTKDNAVLVGLSLPSLPWKVDGKSKPIPSNHSLNNNLLTVLKTVVMPDVTVVSWTTPLNGMNPTLLISKKIISTELETDNAKKLLLHLLPRLLVSLMLPLTPLINSKLLSTRPSSLLPLKLINLLGNSITPES